MRSDFSSASSRRFSSISVHLVSLPWEISPCIIISSTYYMQQERQDLYKVLYQIVLVTNRQTDMRQINNYEFLCPIATDQPHKSNTINSIKGFHPLSTLSSLYYLFVNSSFHARRKASGNLINTIFHSTTIFTFNWDSQSRLGQHQ